GPHLLPLAEAVRPAQGGPGEAPEGTRAGECPAEAGGGRADGGQDDPERGGRGRILSPARLRDAVAHVRGRLGYSERRVCRALGIGRSTIRYGPTPPRADGGPLRAAVVRLAAQYGRYGYR